MSVALRLGEGTWLWASVSSSRLPVGRLGGSGEVICHAQPQTHFVLSPCKLRADSPVPLVAGSGDLFLDFLPSPLAVWALLL